MQINSNLPLTITGRSHILLLSVKKEQLLRLAFINKTTYYRSHSLNIKLIFHRLRLIFQVNTLCKLDEGTWVEAKLGGEVSVLMVAAIQL